MDDLIRSVHERHNLDDTTDKYVQRVLLELRWKRFLEPYVVSAIAFYGMLKVLWRMSYGRYRKAIAKDNGGAKQTPGTRSVTISAAGAGYTNAPVSIAVAGVGSAPVTVPVPNNSIRHAGIRAGELIAYRCWLLTDNGDALTNVYQSHFVWHPGEVAGGDLANPGEGVHGFKDRFSACAYMQEYANSLNSGTEIVSGTVSLWGEVVEHERGYRAEFAAIHSIDESPNYDAKALRRKYLRKPRRSKKLD